MPKSFLLRGAAFFFAALSPVFVCAQFQQPTDEELKMTSAPKAPDAAAVYLYREETTNENLRLQTFYARIKVLAEKGKDLATVKIPFVPDATKVDKVEGRTIHSDGTVIPLSVKPEDLVDFKSKYFREDTLVFTLPSVEVGSILEYRLQIRYNYGIRAPSWELPVPLFHPKGALRLQSGLSSRLALGRSWQNPRPPRGRGYASQCPGLGSEQQRPLHFGPYRRSAGS